MRYFQGIPEDFLRKSFEYDPESPSGLVKLRTFQEQRDKANHVCKPKGQTRFLAHIHIDGKNHQKSFPFGKNGKSELQAESEAHAFIEKTKNENPESIKTVGYKRKDGYWDNIVMYNGKRINVLVHRLVFFLCNKKIDIEKKKIDHIDNNRSNNRKENLQIATSSQNSHNAKLSKRNNTGTKGLSDYVERHYFYAQVMNKRKSHYKLFPYGKTPTEEHKEKIRATAVIWLRETRQRLHGEFANHGDTE
jgi:hypothetical protein